ncbi:MAG: CBS domain-containing protein [Pirellulaceae bacterium]|nr:CBS domain-containing protein [Pirellulaceae bacterium]
MTDIDLPHVSSATYRLRRSRRGAIALEYAIMLVVLVAGAFAISTVGTNAFSATQTLRTAVADTDLPSDSLSSETSIATAATEAAGNSMALMSLVVLCLSATCFIAVRRLCNTNQSETPTLENAQEPAAEKPCANENLRRRILEKRDVLFSEMSKDLRGLVGTQVTVGDLMSTKMRVVSPDLPAENVRAMMSNFKMHHLLICDDSRLVGVISDRDLAKSRARYASDLMTADPISVTPLTQLIPTVSTMINKRISCLPVVENGELKGVLTRTDLLVAFQCMLQIMSKTLHQAESQSDDDSDDCLSELATDPVLAN